MRLVEDPDNEREKPARSVRQRMERAREKWVDVERRIRQRMRIYPQKLRGMITSRAERAREIDESELRLPPGGHASSPDPVADRPRRKPIVSIRGQEAKEEAKEDTDETESDHPLAS